MRISITGSGKNFLATIRSFRQQGIPHTFLFERNPVLPDLFVSSKRMVVHWTSSATMRELCDCRENLCYTLIVRERDLTLLKLISSVDIVVL